MSSPAAVVTTAIDVDRLAAPLVLAFSSDAMVTYMRDASLSTGVHSILPISGARPYGTRPDRRPCK
jgi:hypothetical protein